MIMIQGPSDGISALKKKNKRQQRFLLYHIRTQQEGNCPQARRGPLRRTKFAGIFILDFSASRTAKNNVLFKPPSLWYFVTAA